MLGLQACGGPSVEALRPVAQQNQQNIQALSQNVQTLLSLYEPLLQASGDALMFQHIARIQSEMIAVVGPPTLPIKGNTWDEAFEKSGQSFVGKKGKFNERFQSVKTTLQRGIDAAETAQLQQREGWIYTAAANPSFTPQQAHELLKTLNELKRTAGDGQAKVFYNEAISRLLPHDPNLAFRKQAIDGAIILLDALRQEMNNQLQMLNSHSQALIYYSESDIDISGSFKGLLDSEEVGGLLNQLGTKYIKDPDQRQAAMNLLTSGADAFK
jgi:hypothetical protein